MQTIPEITAEKLIVQYEAILFDAYGVLMHSSGALPGAVDLIEKLTTIKKPTDTIVDVKLNLSEFT